MNAQVAEMVMSGALGESMERLFRWARRHPVTVTTAAMLLVAALAVPIARQSVSSPSFQPPADLGPDETPLFI
jgi:hypothetical protein